VKKRTVFGLPLNPAHLLDQLAGHSFCVSYYHRSKLGRQLVQAIDLVGEDQLLMVDNGAFSAWRSGKALDEQHWDAFARWGIRILDACPQAVMVIPDVIGGTVEENHQLACDFTAGLSLLYGRNDLVDRCMMVWHMHEAVEHLLGMVEGGYQYIAVGSSGEYAKVGTPAWHARIREAFAALDGLCQEGSGYRRPWMHLMRGQSMFHLYPFDSCSVRTPARGTSPAWRAGSSSGPTPAATGWIGSRVPLRWRNSAVGGGHSTEEVQHEDQAGEVQCLAQLRGHVVLRTRDRARGGVHHRMGAVQRQPDYQGKVAALRKEVEERHLSGAALVRGAGRPA
jgi:hypothetical protein